MLAKQLPCADFELFSLVAADQKTHVEITEQEQRHTVADLSYSFGIGQWISSDRTQPCDIYCFKLYGISVRSQQVTGLGQPMNGLGSNLIVFWGLVVLHWFN